jgi:hypothetical protein
MVDASEVRITGGGGCEKSVLVGLGETIRKRLQQPCLVRIDSVL